MRPESSCSRWAPAGATKRAGRRAPSGAPARWSELAEDPREAGSSFCVTLICALAFATHAHIKAPAYCRYFDRPTHRRNPGRAPLAAMSRALAGTRDRSAPSQPTASPPLASPRANAEIGHAAPEFFQRPLFRHQILPRSAKKMLTPLFSARNQLTTSKEVFAPQFMFESGLKAPRGRCLGHPFTLTE